MKTLDEVIEAFARDEEYLCSACPLGEYCRGIKVSCYMVDALHYLKEYKNADENYKKAIAHVTEVIDHYEKMVADYLAVNNPPLTWDELKSMEDEPVWLEWSSDGQWVLIAYSLNNDIKYFRFCDDRSFVLTRDDYEPDKWQAYRKERG